jgi:Fic family protein
MNELIKDAGSYRKEGVGIVKGDKVEHLAPPHNIVPFLMNDLFEYLKDPNEL